MARLPEGDPAPASGALPNPDVARGFGAYVHIPFCATRCGYCDFNTYTNLDFGPGAAAASFEQTLTREIELSARVLEVGVTKDPKLTSIFFGGGTPTMLSAPQLVAVLDELRRTFGIAPGAEVTTEANPETVSFVMLEQLRAGGFTRISFGMQSAREHVLETLDRRHTPGQVQQACEWARDLGFEYSVDLIYGTPGESIEDWRASLEAAIALNPGHISAYALTVEPDTPMGRAVRKGTLPEPSPDDQADKYELADEVLSSAGYQWYEISNWSKPGKESRHNLAYWHESNWWGYGPGAHSHVNGTRWWNVKHPLAYATRLGEGQSPAYSREVLSASEVREELIMMGIRLREGIDRPEGVSAQTVAQLIADGLVEPQAALRGKLVLTLRGRLLADTVIRELW